MTDALYNELENYSKVPSETNLFKIDCRVYTIYGLAKIFSKVYSKSIPIRILSQLTTKLELHFESNKIPIFSKGSLDAFVVYSRMKIERLFHYVVFKGPLMLGQYLSLPKHNAESDFCQSALYSKKSDDSESIQKRAKLFEIDSISEMSHEYEQLFRHLIDKQEIRVGSKSWSHSNPGDKIYETGQLIEQQENRPLKLQNILSASQLRKKRVAEIKNKAIRKNVAEIEATHGTPVSKSDKTESGWWKERRRKSQRFPDKIFEIEPADFVIKVESELKDEIKNKTKKITKNSKEKIRAAELKEDLENSRLRNEEREENAKKAHESVKAEQKRIVEKRRAEAREKKNRLRREERRDAKLKRLVDQGYSNPEEIIREKKRRRLSWNIGSKHKLRKSEKLVDKQKELSSTTLPAVVPAHEEAESTALTEINQQNKHKTNSRELSSKDNNGVKSTQKYSKTKFSNQMSIPIGQVVELDDDVCDPADWPMCNEGRLAEVIEQDQLSILVVLLKTEETSFLQRSEKEIHICTEDITNLLFGTTVTQR